MRATLTAAVTVLIAGLGASSASAAITITGPASEPEPASTSTNATYTVSRALDPTLFATDATVTVTATSGTAASGADFVATTQTVTLGALTGRTATVSVPVLPDALDEFDETFTVTLGNVSANETIGTPGSVTTTITDNGGDAEPTVSVGAASVAEGTSAAATTLSVPVTLSGPSGKEIKVNYATADGTAEAGTDFTGTAGNLTIPAGQPGGTIAVPVAADVVDEDDETLTTTISTPVNVTLGTTVTATGTIADDDTAAVSVLGTTVTEGAAGAATPAEATVLLSVPSENPVTVKYATADGTAVATTATAPGDYAAGDGQVTIPAGSQVATIPLVVVGDAVPERDEAFSVVLREPTQAAVADGGGTGTVVIRNDDTASTNPEFPAPPGSVTTKPGTNSSLPPGITNSLRGVALGKPSFSRATKALRFVVTCPLGIGRCKGTLTVFSVPVLRGTVKALRTERQLGLKRFDVVAGSKVTLSIRLDARARSWLRAARTIKTTSHAVSRDTNGAISTAKAAKTLKR